MISKSMAEKNVSYYRQVQSDIEKIMWSMAKYNDPVCYCCNSPDRVFSHLHDAVDEIERVITSLLDNVEDDDVIQGLYLEET